MGRSWEMGEGLPRHPGVRGRWVRLIFEGGPRGAKCSKRC